MQCAQAGDIAAYGALFDRYQVRLARFLTRILHNSHSAEDIAQEAFWNVWERRHTYNPRRSFRVFLYVAAKNLALNERNRAHHRNIVPLESIAEPVATDDPVAASERQQLQCAVRRALLDLPENQRICIVLHEYEGYSYREIAAVLECSEIQARVVGFRARNRLKRLLGPLMESEVENEQS
jgi:RNA polymerase sigma-70 factor, ECF subfamily